MSNRKHQWYEILIAITVAVWLSVWIIGAIEIPTDGSLYNPACTKAYDTLQVIIHGATE